MSHARRLAPAGLFLTTTQISTRNRYNQDGLDVLSSSRLVPHPSVLRQIPQPAVCPLKVWPTDPFVQRALRHALYYALIAAALSQDESQSKGLVWQVGRVQ